jgi:Cu-Zn family superoxide dismutase
MLLRRFVTALVVLSVAAALCGCETMRSGMQNSVDTVKTVGKSVGTSVKEMVVTPPAASVLLLPTRGSEARGTVKLVQKDERVLVSGKVQGLKPGSYRLEVHQRGNCTAVDGASAGPVFETPTPRPPDLPASSRFGGDLGPLEVEPDGIASFAFEVAGIGLGGDPDTIVGRSLIVRGPIGAGGVNVPRAACGLVNLARTE